MTANSTASENDLALGAVSWLRQHLPSTWEVGPTGRAEFQTGERRFDAAIDLRGPNGVFTTMIVEAKRTVGPRDVERLLTGVGRSLRTLAGNVPILVVAPWLSARTQEMLTAESLNYLDFTGNALIRLDNPTVYIETRGASKDPHPQTRNKARVQGPKAGRLVRWLIDVRPPYGVRELAASADLAISYVSRVLETLDSEALVDRSPRGRVESVDIPRLLRRWAENYDVFRSNQTLRYLAPGGANQALTPPRIDASANSGDGFLRRESDSSGRGADAAECVHRCTRVSCTDTWANRGGPGRERCAPRSIRLRCVGPKYQRRRTHLRCSVPSGY